MNPTLRLCVPLLCTTLLSAQKTPLPDGSGRIVQMFDLHRLRPPDDAPPPAPAAPRLGLVVPAPPTPTSHAAFVAQTLARFVEPPLGRDDALAPLGERWLALLGSPAQAASVERMFELARTHGDRSIEVGVTLWTVSDATFRAHVAERLPAAQPGRGVKREAVLAMPAAAELEGQLAAAKAEQIESPRLTVYPLQRADMSVMNQTAYVKDFTISRVAGRVVADPVVDTVWDGVRTEVVATFLPGDAIGITCDCTVQELERPIAEFQTTIGIDKPVSIQLPSLTSVQLRQTAALTDGASVVLASQRADGRWLVATVRAISGR